MKKENKIKVPRILTRTFNWLLYIMPVALVFSYHPVMRLGASESMNFELSVALVWLVVFDVVAAILFCYRGISWREFWRKKWAWLLFPLFVTVSLFWTENLVRGILTVGILWLIYIAVFSFFELREFLEDNFRRNFLRWFFGASLFVCAWCVAQCVLDLVGVSREVSLMCAGCVTEMFGFPHPNGFAIEPQFMGNLLIAPAIVSGYMLVVSRNSNAGTIFFVTTATLFLTFSRGAIYAFAVALIFFVVFEIVRTKKFRVLVLPVVAGLAFLFTLNLQGIFASVSNTNDTYFSGVAKVLNHLSLGIIDIEVPAGGNAEATSGIIAAEKNDAIFDGYVEESTNVRLMLSGAAVRVWSRDFGTAMFGVGVGGTGEALYAAGETGTPKEIVQNEYVNLLLEVGVVGILLFVLTVALIIRAVWRNEKSGMVLTLIVAYAVTLLFFSGLPNALQIYLMPSILYISLRKKLVS